MLYDESYMRPDNTVITSELYVFKTDEANFKPYVSTLASSNTLVDNNKGYHYHRGAKTDDKLIVKDLISVSWNSDYEDWSGTAKITIPYKKSYLEYIQKGVYIELYINRYPKGADVDYLKRLDSEIISKSEADKNKAYEEWLKEKHTYKDAFEKYVHIFYPYYWLFVEKSFSGFITDIKYNPDSLELTISNYGALLDEQGELAYKEMFRSHIIEDVIYTAGLIPNIDIKDLPNDIIDWSSSKDTGSSGTANTGEDCTDTNTMSCLNGCSSSNYYGSGHDFTEASKKGYANKEAEYYKWARQFSSGEAMLKALRNIWKYHLYWDNKTCPDKLFNVNGFESNCYDACRLVKCLCDSIGFPCVVVTGTAYEGVHGWNVIKTKGQWLSFDLCYGSQANSTNSTNMSMIF